MDLDFRPGKSRQVTHQRRPIPADYLQRRQAAQRKPVGRHNASTSNARWRLLRAASCSRARWAAATVVATLLLVALPLLWPTAGSPQSQPLLGNDATLKASKKIFAVDEDPSFHLDFPKPQVGWLDLPSMVGRAAAAEAVRTTVYYDNGQPVNIPAHITPDGSHSFTVQLQPDSRVKPGRYSVVAEWGSGKNVHSVTQNFAWGVLAINTTQAAYVPGEKVNIEMGVLNSRGNTICDAPLQLTVTTPNGKSTLQAVSRSGKCKGDTYVTAPDYTAAFVPHEIGRYKLDLRLSDSDYRITSDFTVLKSLPYKISRQGPTRIYPFHPYTMRLQVTPKQHFTGSVTETLPASFAVPNNGGGHVSKTKQAVTISWQANWQAGKTYHLSYTFKAPLVSPAFYYVQPLQLKAQSGQSYTEPRAWQIASDAVITFVQEASADLGSMSSTGHITFNSTAGNTLILILAQTANNQGISNITDSAGNTWVWPATGDSQNPASAYNGSGNNQLNMAYAVNAAAVSWIQIDIPASNKMTYDISEFSNVASTNAVDQSAAAGEGATTTHSTPTITTTNASDLIIGGMNPTGTNTFSNYGSFTPLAAANAIGAGYQVVNTTGSYAFSLTVSASKSAGTGIMAFKAGTGGGGGGGGGSSCTVMGGGNSTISFVKQTEVDVSSGASSTTNVTSTAGDALILVFTMKAGYANSGSSTGPFGASTVTDSAGNSWTYPTADPSTNPPGLAVKGSNSYIAVAYVLNASAITSITVAPTVAIAYSYNVLEFSGIASASAVDQSNSTTTLAATAHSTPTVTTTNANDLIIGVLGGTTTPEWTLNSGGYTALSKLNPSADSYYGEAAYKIVSSTGTQSASWTAGSATDSATGIMAFKAGTGGSTGSSSVDLQMRGGNYFCNGVEQGYFWAL